MSIARPRIAALVLSGAAALAPGCKTSAPPLLPGARKVTVNLAWLPQGSTGGILVAIAKGFYADAGLQVEASRGYGGQRAVNEVDEGLFDFAYGDPVSVLINRSQGGRTRLIGAINTKWPGALCYLDEPGRRWESLADLKGLTLGGGAASPLHNIVPEWLEENGLAPDHLKLVRLDPAVINSSLLEGTIDLAECWEGANRPVLSLLADKDGKKIRWLRYRDFGLDLYGNGLVTTENLIDKEPDVVRRFVRATFRGYAFMRDHPQESAEIILATHRLLDRNALLEQIEETNQIVADADPDNRGLGWMREDRMRSTVDFVKKAFQLTSPEEPSEIYTNQFVE
jgi:NitT/TauT family transport system substrate-binding protein